MNENKTYIIKGAGLILCGALIGFVPNIITYLFYGVGLFILLLCAVRLVSSISKGTFNGMFVSCLFGALAGCAVMALPRFIKVQIPLITGIIFTVMGVSRLIRTFGSEYSGNKTAGIITSVFLTFCGIFFMLNPLKISSAFRVAIGLAVIILGIFNLIAAFRIKQQNENVQPTVVDVESYSVEDDK